MSIADIASSTIILTFGVHDKNINSDVGAGRFNAWWQMAIETLENINRKHPMAGQCAVALSAIRQRCVSTLKAQKRVYSPSFTVKICRTTA